MEHGVGRKIIQMGAVDGHIMMRILTVLLIDSNFVVYGYSREKPSSQLSYTLPGDTLPRDTRSQETISQEICCGATSIKGWRCRITCLIENDAVKRLLVVS